MRNSCVRGIGAAVMGARAGQADLPQSESPRPLTPSPSPHRLAVSSRTAASAQKPPSRRRTPFPQLPIALLSVISSSLILCTTTPLRPSALEVTESVVGATSVLHLRSRIHS
ncbi:hypothetical protein HAX54_003020 [Datura stramonium]|uniref:Uncharacterized protein n=1 Tax=Datura stramonium TaxID=4076 RepID=A0ABS8WRU3_DATST|nr:hypothetical protein [Datura stramonium]